ncbi:hypothetical protein DCAR_0311846 [Daucus carota subsp. sativus]|uniref:Uncharacterized protein n=1 Tax=Daucus carota subsp. sativus TaxID=79200 RepID=A0A166AQZ4_DAUCS|nr:hypothetical protein DCAR_0311846 [Daucus carota subsp. sativus]
MVHDPDVDALHCLYISTEIRVSLKNYTSEANGAKQEKQEENAGSEKKNESEYSPAKTNSSSSTTSRKMLLPSEKYSEMGESSKTLSDKIDKLIEAIEKMTAAIKANQRRKFKCSITS